MKLDIITLFPRFFDGVFSQSILSRAVEQKLIDVNIHHLRDYTTDKHQQADDYRFGGGPGMLLKPEPLFRACEKLIKNVKPRPLVVYTSAQGELFTQETAETLSRERHLVFICGHYKGIDQRVIERWVDREYSLGDFVVTGGEPVVATMIDASVRLMHGVLGDLGSAHTDSFQGQELDCPHYTRPEIVGNLGVPAVLMSGHHKNIDAWRLSASKLATKKRRK